MPSSSDAEPPAAAGSGFLEALITQADRLRGGIDAARRGGGSGAGSGDGDTTDPEHRWQRALWDLAACQADDLGGRLSQLRDGAGSVLPGQVEPGARGPSRPVTAASGGKSLVGRVGSADWNLLTDEVTWSPELYRIFGRTATDGPLSLDELPSWVWSEDQGALTAAVTDCLVDGRPIDGEFRFVRPDGAVRTVHLIGEPVLDADGGTASMWAVLRDVSELRRTEQAVRESRESLQRQRHVRETERRLATELQQTVLPPWRGPRRFPQRGRHRGGALETAAHCLPSATGSLSGGCWYDALELPGGSCLLTAGDLTGHGTAATSGMALLVGAVRGMSVAGVQPGGLLAHLNTLLDAAAQPALGSAVCCRYDPSNRALTWSQAGHPAPLLFRGGRGAALPAPEGVLLGATSGPSYGQRTEHLEPGDLLVLHAGGPAPSGAGVEGAEEGRSMSSLLLEMAPRFASAHSAQECLRAVVETFGGRGGREDDACVLVARVE